MPRAAGSFVITSNDPAGAGRNSSASGLLSVSHALQSARGRNAQRDSLHGLTVSLPGDMLFNVIAHAARLLVVLASPKSGIGARVIKLKIPWDDLGKVATVAAAVFAGAGLWFAGIQIRDSHKVEVARFALQFDERLAKSQLVAVVDDTEGTPPDKILKENGGVSTDDDLEELLGDYDTLYDFYRDDLVSDKLLNDMFCTDIEGVHNDGEVREYLKADRARPDAKDTYSGFDKLASICTAWDRSGRSHDLDR